MKQLTWDEVRKHATPNDGWIVIRGKVYDVSTYAPSHPGGPQGIGKYLGRDATEAYDTKRGMGISHSEFATVELAKLLVGEVEGPEPSDKS